MFKTDYYGYYDPKRRYIDPNKPKFDPNKLEIDLNKVQNDPNKLKFDPNRSISDWILYLIKNSPKISYKEMAEITGKSIPTIKRSITKLKEEGLIKRSGSPRGGKWVLVKSENSWKK
ncbi:MAG: replication/maintenance protein RepL [Candidatus Cloacimonas sp.]